MMKKMKKTNERKKTKIEKYWTENREWLAWVVLILVIILASVFLHWVSGLVINL